MKISIYKSTQKHWLSLLITAAKVTTSARANFYNMESQYSYQFSNNQSLADDRSETIGRYDFGSYGKWIVEFLRKFENRGTKIALVLNGKYT